MRFHRAGVVLAAAVAALTVGVGSASAGTGPVPKAPSVARHSTAPSSAGNPASIRAQAAGVCTDAYQIGKTTYLGTASDGTHYASLKQFYSPSCKQNYGYLWVWDQYLKAHTAPYEVRIGVWDENTDTVVGQVITKNTRQQEFWSKGASTVADCTAGDGFLLTPDVKLYNQTDVRC